MCGAQYFDNDAQDGDYGRKCFEEVRLAPTPVFFCNLREETRQERDRSKFRKVKVSESPVTLARRAEVTLTGKRTCTNDTCMLRDVQRVFSQRVPCDETGGPMAQD